MKLIKLSIFVFLMHLQFNSFAQTEGATTPTHKVVIQLNTADTAAWSGVIGNIKNLSKVWPGNIKFEVVVHGKALDFLVAAKSHLVTDIDQLAKKEAETKKKTTSRKGDNLGTVSGKDW